MEGSLCLLHGLMENSTKNVKQPEWIQMLSMEHEGLFFFQGTFFLFICSCAAANSISLLTADMIYKTPLGFFLQAWRIGHQAHFSADLLQPFPL